jgi:alpha-galactosidase
MAGQPGSAGHRQGTYWSRLFTHDSGTWLREIRSGRTGPDAALVLAAGTPDFGFGFGFGSGSGEVWELHIA